MSSSIATLLTSSRPIESALILLDSVYGSVDSPNFPQPLPSDEAGLCADGRQRRYLWTDAFGVLAYLSLADCFQSSTNSEQQKESGKYRQAANRLIDTTHACLGTPRSYPMTVDAQSPTGYIGLRIGKIDERRVTDYGMSYDGMYWHYTDKWLLALARAGRVEEALCIVKSVFPHFFDAGPYGNGDGGGMRWKLSVDATPPPELQRAHASDDSLTALIVFSMLEQERAQEMPSLECELELLRQALKVYHPRVTDDPLGWGLEALFDQFLEGHPRQTALKSLHRSALHQSHLSLPFRLYGAIMGAKVTSVAPINLVDKLVDLSLQHEQEAMRQGDEEHSSINRVMLAMCLLSPGSLGRRPTDPLLRLN